jgi:hypothetical protein
MKYMYILLSLILSGCFIIDYYDNQNKKELEQINVNYDSLYQHYMDNLEYDTQLTIDPVIDTSLNNIQDSLDQEYQNIMNEFLNKYDAE